MNAFYREAVETLDLLGEQDRQGKRDHKDQLVHLVPWEMREHK